MVNDIDCDEKASMGSKLSDEDDSSEEIFFDLNMQVSSRTSRSEDTKPYSRKEVFDTSNLGTKV